MLKILLFVSATCFLQLLSVSSLAQANQANKVDSVAIMKWLSMNFSFDKPDTGFVALAEGNGYNNPAMNATIKFISFPQEYYAVKSEFLGHNAMEINLRIDTVTHRLNNLEAFSIIHEEISPDKSKYENYISITTLVKFEDVTVCVIGAYPKSKDKLFRSKFITAALSIKEQ